MSKVARSQASSQALFALLSTFEHLSRLSGVERIEHVEATADDCEITVKGVPMKLAARIVNRTPFKEVKYSDVDGKPLRFMAWVQLVDVPAGGTAIRITLDLSVPLIYKMFLTKSKIQEGLDRAVDQLAMLPA